MLGSSWESASGLDLSSSVRARLWLPVGSHKNGSEKENEREYVAYICVGTQRTINKLEQACK